ncbi:uncharacterized protein TNIN_439331 [Trichonephila inaurata madagascariensis]|uniref:Uncharacterized protein n=1 Tax=Trichonephila inaurata madagascariensis TaxID=2747483 RepID=A0A8X7CD91_9ARAC|nr:uncharacterized protein TNIN_439331 [Trichonephila inaurata madagascariensis]
MRLIAIKVTETAESKKKNNSEESKANDVKVSLTCSFIRDVFHHLLIGMIRSRELKNIHYLYENIMNMLNDMDSDFSFPAFITVIISTNGLFCDVYRTSFYKNQTSGYIFFTLSGFSYLVLLLLFMISGSSSNELANKVKIHIQCLPLETAENQPKMSSIKKTLLQEDGLTLWKIYVMDRSLVIGTFGTLLTYGILLGSLGKNEA